LNATLDTAMPSERTYTIVLDPDPEGGFVVHVPALPEVCTQGDTEADALANAREAIELAVEERMSAGEPVPGDQIPQVRKVKVDVPTAA
jgi:antitoxin HicB